MANASWGGSYGYPGDAGYDAIRYAGTKGEVFVTAAGNDGWDLDSPYYNSYPAEYNLDNIIVVAATTSAGGLAYYSDYGGTAVDVAAPGSSVLSTLPGNRYGFLSGTSMAAPMVTGTAALMLAANPALTAAQIKQRLVGGADQSAALNNRTVSDGEVNAYNALLARAGTPLTAVSSPVQGTLVGGSVVPRSPVYYVSYFSTSNGTRSIDAGSADPRRRLRDVVWRV